MTALVEISSLRKSYWRGESEVPVLADLDLRVERGEFVALMGPSGSGKSTLLNLIAGLDQPTEGSLRIAGHEIGSLGDRALDRWRNRSIGFVFQFYNLVPVLSAFENVEVPLLLWPISREERTLRVAAALRVVGLVERMDHRPGELSGGEQQRVAIARALVTDPLLVLADEPTGDLDERNADEVLALMQLLNRAGGKTFVMVTHDPRAAAQAGRIVRLEKGRLVDEAA
ncbi:MAG: ABC transporter ATP-binding protein [Myxococcota bacterium]